MGRPFLAVASGNRAGADAAVDVARAGGNAVDACLTAAVTAWVAEPFLTSLGGSGFVTVRAADGIVEVFDGNNAMPLHVPDEPGRGLTRVWLEDYSNGMFTGIGGGSVAVPGVLAAVHAAWERHGRIEWAALFQPAIAAARRGIDFPETSAYYLSMTYREIWSRHVSARSTFLPNGRILEEGARFVQPELADALELVAAEGPGAFFGGVLGERMIEMIRTDGGFLSVDDLVHYRCEVREPVTTEAFGWEVSANPPPAVGGAVLVHMLALLEGTTFETPLERIRAIVQAERAAIGHRDEHYEDPSEIAGALDEMLTGLRGRAVRSPSTTHSSAADVDGCACAVTESSGYGAGLLVDGIILNNTLGEEELNPRGAHGLPPGARCHSNMTPTVATGPHSVLAIGSPGADRIVGAIAQTLMRVALDGMPLQEAVLAPRVHLAKKGDHDLLCFEPGVPGVELAEELGVKPRPYEARHMFFGATHSAIAHSDGTLEAAHDPRRSGGAVVA